MADDKRIDRINGDMTEAQVHRASVREQCRQTDALERIAKAMEEQNRLHVIVATAVNQLAGIK